MHDGPWYVDTWLYFLHVWLRCLRRKHRNSLKSIGVPCDITLIIPYLGSCRIMKSGKIIISQLSGERLRIRQIHIEVKLSWRIECKNALDTRRDLVRCSLRHFQPVLSDSSIKSCILQARMMQDLLTVELIEGVQIWNTCPKTYGSRIL